MQKMVDGKVVDMTAAEITKRNSEIEDDLIRQAEVKAADTANRDKVDRALATIGLTLEDVRRAL